MRRNAFLFLVTASLTGGAAPVAGQGYATALAVGEGEVFIAEPLNPYAKGTVYVYQPDARGGWKEVTRFEAADGSLLDRFGRSISYDGGRLLVGATSIDSVRGAAFLFERDPAGTWRQAAKLVPAEAVDGDAWGRQVLLRGEVAYVASWGRNDGRGGVAVYRRGADGRWTEETILGASDPAENDYFGSSLAADGDRLLIGAAQKDSAMGVAYLFRRDPVTGRWTEEARLRGRGISRNSGFGGTVALKGDEALIAATGLERGMGAVYQFTRDSASGEWQEAARLAAFDGTPQAQFGGTIAYVDHELWVGAPGAENRQGRIYRLTRDAEGRWAGASKLGRDDLQRNDAFGAAFAVVGDRGVVGLTGDDHGMGTAVVLRRAEGGVWNMSDRIWSESKGLDPVIGGKQDCTAGKASLFDCESMELLSFLPISAIGGGRGVRLNDVWGWTDPQSSREYALVGRIDGTAFVDITDPVNPVYLGELPKTPGSQANAWRDIKVYQDHAFIVADGALAHGMQVFDLTRLRGVRNPPVTFTEDAHYDKIHSSHNIVIDTTAGFAFAVGASGGGETCGGALHMIDIRTPQRPSFAGCYADPATGRQRTGYTHDAQCVVYQGPDQDYRGHQICFNSSETALGIADVTEKAHPTAIAHAAYPNVGYTHQGWLTDDHRYFYMDDEGDEIQGTVQGTRTLIWDLADLDEPVLLAEYVSTNRASDHNLYIKGNLMYQSNYSSGLRVLDISDPRNPKPVGFFDTMPVGEDQPGFSGSWSNYPYFKSGTVVVTSIGEGVYMVRKSDRTLIP